MLTDIEERASAGMQVGRPDWQGAAVPWSCPWFRIETLGTWNRVVPAVSGGPSGAVIVPFLGDDPRDREVRFLLVEQYRRPVCRSMIEFPRGGIEENESDLACAARETAEETGCLVHGIRALGTVHPDSGLLSSELSIVLCAVTRPDGSGPLDSDEIDRVYALTRRQIREAVTTGRITDSLTLSALALLELHYPER